MWNKRFTKIASAIGRRLCIDSSPALDQPRHVVRRVDIDETLRDAQLPAS
jgi:hypothetical protein